MEENLIIDKEILKYDCSHPHPEKEYDNIIQLNPQLSRNLNKKTTIQCNNIG
ncbi:hypothetical protein U3516DRAFT_735015 [Neocallimastix sp. 'constans']